MRPNASDEHFTPLDAAFVSCFCESDSIRGIVFSTDSGTIEDNPPSTTITKIITPIPISTVERFIFLNYQLKFIKCSMPHLGKYLMRVMFDFDFKSIVFILIPKSTGQPACFGYFWNCTSGCSCNTDTQHISLQHVQHLLSLMHMHHSLLLRSLYDSNLN